MKISQSFYAPPALKDASIAEYLPLNLRDNLKGSGYNLATIDPEVRNDLLRFNWKTTILGTVYRVYRDAESSRRTGKAVNHVEHLALRLLDLAPYSRWFPINGDVLDLRVSNLKAGVASPEFSSVEPGSSFRDLPSFASAVADRLMQKASYAELLRFGRPPRLNEEKVRTFLEAVRDDPQLKGATLTTIAEWMHDRFGFGFYPSVLLRVLRGNALRVRNFDYQSLLATRKSRTEVAIEHWRLRRENQSTDEAA